ncbi:zinc finger C3HC-type protein 1-like [Malurus melanocephalus]|uniref:zinc finger C3HC-type protein 1-like n=1 Tax=Malurus melanocephalus TaxID=175006 RepID=UPI002547FC2A|nr:zinc finger C3HC-type protein 1-like [Malurus melanocephalus]
MAAPSAGGAAAAAAGGNRGRPSPVTPRQIRDLIDGGIATEGPGPGGKDSSEWSEPANGPAQLEALSLESASREAFFSRVETFTISFGVLEIPSGNGGGKNPQGSLV